MSAGPRTPSLDCPKPILDLIARFELRAVTYRRQEYNETQVRREFIDPFFAAMGWDVDNEAGHAEAYKDVIHEDAIKVGGSTKAPDYCFRIGGVRKFFVEAKKPSVSVGDDPAPAYQLRRYAWTNKLPLSIVTDFEELAVYDCRIKPKPDDKPSVARVLYLKHTDYPAKWTDLASIFSKDAILKGSFDKYAESNKRKRGTAEVDDEFLKEIEGWREELARNIALRNPQLGVRDLNYAVGKTIDRIIFLRMCEDRGVETYAQLRMLLSGPRVYPRLVEIFYLADQRYNSGLFHFEPEKDRPDEPDTLTPNLSIDDKVLKDIIKSLSYPDSPYEFSVMPPEILGQVYEQFLGKVIRLTKGHQAVVEEKPEVKKAGGVYYTPKYIVDYIVEHTVGELLKEKKPADVGPMLDAKQNPERKRRADPTRARKEADPQSGERKEADHASPLTKGGSQGGCLRVLDPACGSGSFLLGAYRTLLDWHLRWYTDNAPASWAKKKTPPIYESGSRGWQLTIAEKKRILLNNIFGVDIDPQAVEVTKLSLLLKVLEGESAETIGRTLRLFHERALPDLGDNVKCGNSLIGPDFYNGNQLEMFDDDERYRINVFDWQDEFPGIMRTGGFDAVIGNPPWGADIRQPEKPYFRARFKLNSGKFESYIFFIERAAALLKKDGAFGFIVPSYWISRSQTGALRDYLWGTIWTSSLIVLPEDVFVGVKMDCCILIARTDRPERVKLAEVGRDALRLDPTANGLAASCAAISASLWDSTPSLRFNPRCAPDDTSALGRIAESTVPLGSIVELTQGLTLYRRSTLQLRFGRMKADRIVRNREFHSDHKKDKSYKKELLGRDVARYRVTWNGRSWVSYGPWLAHAVDERFFRGPRLVIQKLRNPTLRQRLVVGYVDDRETYSAGVLLNAILRDDTKYDLFYIMGILNSAMMNYWYRKRTLDVSIRVADLESVPIRSIESGARKIKALHDDVGRTVKRILDLHKRFTAAKSPTDKTAIQRQIDATDRQIDRLVYELYGLTDDEIRIVEGATGDEVARRRQGVR